MKSLKRSHSIGCVDYGNNNFFEVMVEGDEVCFVSHDDGPDAGSENEDGSWESNGDSLQQFIRDIVDRDDFEEIMKEQVIPTLSKIWK